jgi:Ni/Co efflux regulator RcnB
MKAPVQPSFIRSAASSIHVAKTWIAGEPDMKRLAVVGALAVLFAGPLALAAPHDRDDRDDRAEQRSSQHYRKQDRRTDHRRDQASHRYERDHRGYRDPRGYRAPPRWVEHRAYGRYGAYHRPHGYYAHRWRHGERLPVAYYQRPYVIANYHDCGLRAPPRGHHWVRVDGDAVLAAIATGIVLDTVFDVF